MICYYLEIINIKSGDLINCLNDLTEPKLKLRLHILVNKNGAKHLKYII